MSTKRYGPWEKKLKKSIRFPPRLLHAIDEQVRKGRFSTRTAFVEEACWQLIERLRQGTDEAEDTEEQDDDSQQKLVKMYNLVEAAASSAAALLEAQGGRLDGQ